MLQDDRPARTRPRAHGVLKLEEHLCILHEVRYYIQAWGPAGSIDGWDQSTGRPGFRISRTLLRRFAIEICYFYQAKSRNHHVYRILNVPRSRRHRIRRADSYYIISTRGSISHTLQKTWDLTDSNASCTLLTLASEESFSLDKMLLSSS